MRNLPNKCILINEFIIGYHGLILSLVSRGPGGGRVGSVFIEAYMRFPPFSQRPLTTNKLEEVDTYSKRQEVLVLNVCNYSTMH